MVLMPTEPCLPRVLYITLGSWIEDTAHLAARLQSENGGLLLYDVRLSPRMLSSAQV